MQMIKFLFAEVQIVVYQHCAFEVGEDEEVGQCKWNPGSDCHYYSPQLIKTTTE